MSCPDLETVAAWCLDELLQAEADCFEQHYFSCDRCFGRAERLQSMLEQLRASLPPVLTSERRQALEGSQPRLQTARVHAGERATLALSDSARLGIWLMQAPLQHVTRVDLEARGPAGSLLFDLSDVPFDASRGEVALACHVHYRALAMPSELRVRLTLTDPSGRHVLGDYILDHQFDSL